MSGSVKKERVDLNMDLYLIFPDKKNTHHAIPFLKVDWGRRVMRSDPHDRGFNLRRRTKVPFSNLKEMIRHGVLGV